MLKKEITFEDFDGVVHTGAFWFHMSAAELAEWEFTTKGGLVGLMDKISEEKDTTKIFPIFKDVIRRSYGIRDGVHFRKSAEIEEDFMSHPAFSELVIEMLKNPKSAVEFFAGIMPPGAITEAQLMAEIEAQSDDGKIVKNVFEQAENNTGPLPELKPEHYGADAVTLPAEPASDEIYTEKAVEDMTIEELRAALTNPRNNE